MSREAHVRFWERAAVKSRRATRCPLYRQEGIYRRAGLELPRAMLANWVAESARLLDPLVGVLERYVMGAAKLHADDTPVPVLEPGKGRTRTARLWAYVRDERPAAGPDPPAVVYRYSPDRKGEHPRAHLARFDSVGQARMASLHNGSREALEVSPNLWAGIGLINKGVGTALVGDPDTLAERLQEYVDIGADSFILSSYPHLEETYQVAELLFPRLPAWRDKLRQRDDVFSPDRLPTTWQ